MSCTTRTTCRVECRESAESTEKGMLNAGSARCQKFSSRFAERRSQTQAADSNGRGEGSCGRRSRLTADEAYGHEWFQSPALSSDIVLFPHVSKPLSATAR